MDRKRVLLITLVPVLLLLLTVGYMDAQGPDLRAEPGGSKEGNPQAPLGSDFTYQGQLKDAGSSPIDDTCDFTFGLWDAESGGTQEGADSVVTGVAVSNGYFAALVNGGGEFGAGAFVGEERWLEITVQCTGDPTPVTLSPRHELSAAPYALSLQPGATISGTVAGGNSLTVINNDPTGRGVYGWASATSGTTYGVVGYSDSIAGMGVAGFQTGYDISDLGGYWKPGGLFGGRNGLVGITKDSAGYGVLGWSKATSGATFGVRGESGSTGGRGVTGYAAASSGVTYGVYGQSNSPSGYGVYGRASAINADYGVYSWGNTGATGTKSAIVQTRDYGWRHLYAMESPDVLFEDVGTAQLMNGQAVVTIDALFAQTVNLEEPYQIFLTPVSSGPVLLFVSAQSSSGFTVLGVTLAGQPAACSFHYRIIAKRLGYEDTRLAPAADPTLNGEVPEREVAP